jgi:WD40 repeat protein
MGGPANSPRASFEEVMAEAFDPYRKWLGIPPAEQPPNHYRLLGIGLFEADDDVIESAADRQMSHIQRHQLGQYAAISQRLLNELSAAKLCLLKADRKDAYDRALRKQLAAKTPETPPAVRPAVATPPAAAEPRRPNPAETVAEYADETEADESPAIPELPQRRQPIGKRQRVVPQRSAAKRAAGKTTGSKKPSPNVLIIGGAIAAGVVVLTIIAVVASRDKPAPAVARKLATDASTPPGESPKPAAKPEVEPEPSQSTKPVAAHDAEPEAKPAAIEAPTEPPTVAQTDSNELTTGDITNLLPLVKLSAKTAIGKWQKSSKGLTLLASKDALPRLALPFAPPNEYQLELIVEPQPRAELVVALVAGGNQVGLVLDGWDGATSGLNLIDSVPGNANASTHRGRVLTPLKPNRVLITVRGDAIKVICDDSTSIDTIIDWNGPFDRLSFPADQGVTDRRALYLGGGRGTAMRIRSLRLATLSGKGKVLTEPVVAQPDLARVEPTPEMPPETPASLPPSGKVPPAVSESSANFEFVGHTQPIRSIAVHPDSNQVLSASWLAVGDNQPVRSWNLAQRSEGLVPRGDYRINAVEYSSDGSEMFMALEGRTLSRESLSSGQVSWFISTAWPVYCMGVASGRGLAAAGGTRGLIVQSQDGVGQAFQWASPPGAAVASIALSADGNRLWAGCAGNWNTNTPADGNDFKLHFWDGASRNYAELDGHQGGIWSMDLSADGLRLATASQDHTVRVWDAKSNKMLRTLTGHEGPVYAVAISPDGKLVLSGGADKTVRLWEARSGRELKRFAGHTDVVRAVALTPNGRYALSGGNDKVLRVWTLGAPSRRPGAVATNPEPAARRVAVPPQADVDEATKLIRDVFADDFKQAKKAGDKIALAEKLLKQAGDSQTDPERYALLAEARSLAAAGGSPALAIQTIEETGERFEIDSAHEIAELIEPLSKDNLPPAVRKELAEALLPIAENAAARSDYDTARRLLAAASQSARKTNDAALVKQVTARVQEVGDAKKLFDAYRKSIEKIDESPDDPAANLAAGKYLCFVKQDWAQGLPHLAKGGDETLRQIAELELTAPANPEDQVKLGDLWWALFEQTKGPEKADYADRCDKWYGAALPGLKGLTQTKVSKRIEELTGSHRPAAPAGTATAVDRPAAGDAGGAATTATTAKIVAKIKLAIRKETLVRSAAVSGRGGSAFAEIPPAGAILTGFNYTTVPEQDGGELSSIQAIYWTPKGSVNGQRWGVEAGPVKTVVAKKGYAVAGLHAGGSFYEVAWFDVIFAKLGATGLDMSDKYTTAWTGRKSWSTTTLGDNGQLVVGIFGAVNNSQAAGLGLVQLPDK